VALVRLLLESHLRLDLLVLDLDVWVLGRELAELDQVGEALFELGISENMTG